MNATVGSSAFSECVSLVKRRSRWTLTTCATGLCGWGIANGLYRDKPFYSTQGRFRHKHDEALRLQTSLSDRRVPVYGAKASQRPPRTSTEERKLFWR